MTVDLMLFVLMISQANGSLDLGQYSFSVNYRWFIIVESKIIELLLKDDKINTKTPFISKSVVIVVTINASKRIGKYWLKSYTDKVTNCLNVTYYIQTRVFAVRQDYSGLKQTSLD
ncbi:hypothetical protein BY458DRAFT_493807 [Sporodiniella umbellata]|nr:hypothetical protein BY458DRAFT_493807 [Sporodiniella umbellata]